MMIEALVRATSHSCPADANVGHDDKEPEFQAASPNFCNLHHKRSFSENASIVKQFPSDEN
jgi:hypothetical protein